MSVVTGIAGDKGPRGNSAVNSTGSDSPSRVSRRAVALIGVIALMIVWGSTFAVTKVTVREIPPLALAALRFAIAAVVLGPLALARGGLATLPRPLPWLPLAMMGVTGIALFQVAFNLALAHGSATQGALIFALVPAAVALAAVLWLQEVLTRKRMLGMLLSIAGVAVVILGAERTEHAPSPLLGAFWMLAAVIAWAAYTVFAKRLAGYDQVVVIAFVTMIGLAMMLPFAWWELRAAPWPAPSWQGWLGAAFLGVVASALAYLVYSWSLRELDATLVGVFLNLDPIIGVLTAVAFLGEPLRIWLVVGGAVAVIGMWLAAIRETARS
jgi:drug/metabolite transporter (DMT)-like permease